MFNEISTAPLILFTYSNNSWQYLKRIAPDPGCSYFLQGFEAVRRGGADQTYPLGLVDWTRRLMVADLRPLLNGGCTQMFKA